MSRRSLRPQFNQIRIWVQQGRTDAWIAHQLDVSAAELREFRKQHDLTTDGTPDNSSDVDLRDEIEAEIEAAAAEEEARRQAEEEARAKAEAEARAKSEAEAETEGDDDQDDPESDGSEAEGRPRKRRRRRRGGRGRRNQLEGTFDHGDEGYGLWLDPSIQDIQSYTEFWAGERNVIVTVEQDQIVIRRADSGSAEDED